MNYYFLLFFLLIYTKSFSQNDNDELKSLIKELKSNLYSVSVSSIGSKIDTDDKSYYLFLSEKIDNQNNKLLMRDYIRWIEKTLSLVGYNRIIDSISNKYNYRIYVEWGLSSPNKKTVTIPSFNLPSTSTTKVSQDYFTGDLNISTTKTDNSLPSRLDEITTYNRNLSLICKSTSDEDLWFVNSNSEGSSNDLRLIVKVLSFISMKYIEKDSKTTRKIWVEGKLKNEFLDYVEKVYKK